MRTLLLTIAIILSCASAQAAPRQIEAAGQTLTLPDFPGYTDIVGIINANPDIKEKMVGDSPLFAAYFPDADAKKFIDSNLEVDSSPVVLTAAEEKLEFSDFFAMKATLKSHVMPDAKPDTPAEGVSMVAETFNETDNTISILQFTGRPASTDKPPATMTASSFILRNKHLLILVFASKDLDAKALHARVVDFTNRFVMANGENKG